MADVELTDKAIEQLGDLEDHISERIVTKLNETEDWPGHYLESLQGHPLHKLRVGDYRAIVDWNQDKELIIVHKVGHRRNVYK